MSDARQAIAADVLGVVKAAQGRRVRKRAVAVAAAIALVAPSVAAADSQQEETVSTSLFVPILKADKELQIVTGVVLRPETVDAHGDIIGADVIRDSAYKFLAEHNQRTKLKLQHKTYKAGRFDLVESYIVPSDLSIGDKIVKAGSWVMSVRVNDASVWKQVKEGKITGFSIGGRAKVKQLAE